MYHKKTNQPSTNFFTKTDCKRQRYHGGD